MTLDDAPGPYGMPEAALDAQQRLDALTKSGLMDSPADAAYDRITAIARQVTGRPVSLLSLVDASRQFFKSAKGLGGWAAERRETPLSHSFCQHVVRTDDTFIVRDARTDPRVAGNLAITELDVIAYLGVPVRGAGGETLGALCVIDHVPYDWTEADVEHVTALAAMVEDQLRLTQALHDRDLLVREMNHRAGNRMATISSIVRMTGRSAARAAEAVKDIQGRLSAMATADRLILPLAQGGDPADAATDLRALIEPLLAPFTRAGGTRVDLAGPAVRIGSKAAASVALILHELTVNASKYGALGAPAGHLGIAWRTDDTHLHLEWTEDGAAETPEVNPSTGFGSQLLRLSVECQLRGTIRSDVQPGATRHWLELPLEGLSA
ncbi:MAG: GAF domain-containing protein [Pseudomonadota bacterium]